MAQQPAARQLYVQNVKSIFQYNAVRNPGANAILLRDEEEKQVRVSYRKLLHYINRLGTALLRRGLGDAHIAIIGKNSENWCYAYLSVLCGVGVAVPVDREMSAESLVNVIRFASVKAIFTDAATRKKLAAVQKKLPKKLQIFSLDSCDDNKVKSVEDLIQEGETLIDEGDDSYLHRNIDPDALALLLFTSGTTEQAKAVMLSNRNLCADVTLVARRVALTPQDTTLCVLPLHHAYQMICMLMMFYIGGCVSFCPGLRYISRDLAFFSPTVFVCVPLMLEKMHKKIFEQLSKQSGIKRVFTTGRLSSLLERFDWSDFRKFIYKLIHQAFGGKLRLIICGAAALNPDLARDFASFGLPVVIGYGLTECSPIVMCNDANDPQPDSVGQPLDEIDVMLDQADAEGAGEICVRGPVVMLGYYKNKKATNAVLRDGWLHTGDLGYCDENGNFHITGRAKNVIVTKGGKNIYPEELEAYLNNDPVVLESLIFGEARDGDETVVVQVVPDEDAIKEKIGKEKLSNDDVQKAVRDVVGRVNRLLPAYKAIRKVLIRKDRLERTDTQKVIRQSDAQPDDADSENE
ncbi:MAG: AMP-binding protein [Clostridia bacterium]|nr:AMP-binding protein [Clostridia bacterium]